MTVAAPVNREVGRSEKLLFGAFLFAGLASLALGGLAAAGMAFARAPSLPFPDNPVWYYRLLTVHGLSGFYHWFLFFQGALLMLAIGLYVKGARPFSRSLAWGAFGLMAVGAVMHLVAAFSGTEVLYTAFVPLSDQFPRSPLIYLGFLFLAAGVLLLCVNYIATVFTIKVRGMVDELPTATYVGLMWAVVMAAGASVALSIYIPAFRWSLGLTSLMPMAFQMGYMTFFHVNHYVPLIAAVGVWYVLAKHTTGANSVFGERFSKAVFTFYPAVVPPTFLYHLFLAPDIPETTKAVGSFLALFIGVPTIIVAVVVLGMLEARVRGAGHSGPIGWLRHLPWGNPAFAGMALGMVTFGLGGIFAYALLSEGLAELLHGTFVVPGYFHAFTAAGVTLTFMAATYYLVPLITGRQLWGLALARIQPYLLAAGAFVFVNFGVAAGLLGVPRRTPDISYGEAAPAAWAPLMNITEAVGGLLMVAGGVLFVLVVAGTVLAGQRVRTPAEALSGLEPKEFPQRERPAMSWVSAAPAVIVVALMVLVSVVSFELIARWPFVAS
ncbi:MAG: cbb3-type cytochrome c oxidase subunit I [Dehalococcoidia bacterium]